MGRQLQIGGCRRHSVTSRSTDSPGASSTVNFNFHFRFKGVSFVIAYQIIKQPIVMADADQRPTSFYGLTLALQSYFV